MGLSISTWQGGKLRLADKLNKALEVKHSIYIEPFVGAGGLFLNRDITGARQIINDKDIGLYSLWKTLARTDYKDFLINFCSLPVNPDYFSQAYMQMKSGYLGNDQMQKALIIYYLIVYSFNGNMCSMKYKSRENKWKGMKRAAIQKLGDNINETHYRVEGADIYNTDALKLIQQYKYDPEALIYLDPPYLPELMGAKEQLYNIHFSTEQHVLMLALVRDAKARFCISGYRGGSLLYDRYLNMDLSWHTYMIGEVTRSAGMYWAEKGAERNKVREFIWTNYDLPETASYYFCTTDYSLTEQEIMYHLEKQKSA